MSKVKRCIRRGVQCRRDCGVIAHLGWRGRAAGVLLTLVPRRRNIFHLRRAQKSHTLTLLSPISRSHSYKLGNANEITIDSSAGVIPPRHWLLQQLDLQLYLLRKFHLLRLFTCWAIVRREPTTHADTSTHNYLSTILFPRRPISPSFHYYRLLLTFVTACLTKPINSYTCH